MCKLFFPVTYMQQFKISSTIAQTQPLGSSLVILAYLISSTGLRFCLTCSWDRSSTHFFCWVVCFLKRGSCFLIRKMPPGSTHFTVTAPWFVVFVLFSSAETVSRNGVQLSHMKESDVFLSIKEKQERPPTGTGRSIILSKSKRMVKLLTRSQSRKRWQ